MSYTPECNDLRSSNDAPNAGFRSSSFRGLTLIRPDAMYLKTNQSERIARISTTYHIPDWPIECVNENPKCEWVTGFSNNDSAELAQGTSSRISPLYQLTLKRVVQASQNAGSSAVQHSRVVPPCRSQYIQLIRDFTMDTLHMCLSAIRAAGKARNSSRSISAASKAVVRHALAIGCNNLIDIKTSKNRLIITTTHGNQRVNCSSPIGRIAHSGRPRMCADRIDGHW